MSEMDPNKTDFTTPEGPAPKPPPVAETPAGRAVEKLAKESRVFSEAVLHMSGSLGGSPLQGKITSEHITQTLDLAAKQDERRFVLASRDRAWRFASLIVVAALLVTVLLLFQNKPDVLVPVLTGIGGFLGGFAGGWGYAKS